MVNTKQMKILGKALSPLAIIGIILTVSALVGAVVMTTILQPQTVRNNWVVNDSTGITVTENDWTDGGRIAYPATDNLIVGKHYGMEVVLESSAAYKEVTPTFTITKSSANYELTQGDVDIDIYYNGLSFLDVQFDTLSSYPSHAGAADAGGVGTITTTPPVDVVPGQTAHFFVEITYHSTGAYLLTVSAVGAAA